MKYKILLSLIILVLINSCEKPDNQVLFTGIVIDYDNGLPIPVELINIKRYHPDYMNMIDLSDTTITNENGIFNFSFDQNDYYKYSVRCLKQRYVEKFGRIKKSKSIDKSSINTDTLLIGQAGFLKIEVFTSNNKKQYDLYCNFDRPSGTIDPLADYSKSIHSIWSVDSVFVFNEKYLYADNNKVYISLYERDSITMDTFNKVIREVELIPLDTSYLTFDLR